MTVNLAILPTTGGDFVQLARTKTGRLFEKQILKYGEYAHPNIPGEKMVIDQGVAESLVKNFRNGICDIVQVPVVDGANQHVEDPLRNLGEVVDLTFDDAGIKATIDARKPELADELGKTLLGASAMMHFNYTDTKTGDKVGPTLLHVAVTNRPYITNLDDFREVIAASADTTEEEPVLLTEDSVKPVGQQEDTKMERDELLALLKSEHNIDVEALQAAAAEAAKKTTAPSEPTVDQKVLQEAVLSALDQAGVIKLAAGVDTDAITPEDVAAAVVELSQEKVALAGRIDTLETEREEARLSAAVAEVDGLIKTGRVLPTQKDAMVKLAKDDRETFEALLPADSIVALGREGVTTHDAPAQAQLQEEIDRLASKANEEMPRGRRKRSTTATT